MEPVEDPDDEDAIPKEFFIFQAVLHDPEDQMYYISFIHGLDMYILKIDAGPDLRIAQSVTLKAIEDEDRPWMD